jgi:hypothetical protein
MVAFEEKILNYEQENEEVINVIVQGSDEHLDFLSSVRDGLDSLSKSTSKLIPEITADINIFTNDEVIDCLPALLRLYSSSKRLVAALKRKRIDYYLGTCTKEFYAQVDNLREFIYDLDKIRLNEDEEIDQILRDINTAS